MTRTASFHTTPLPSSWSAPVPSPSSSKIKNCVQGDSNTMEATNLDHGNPLSAPARHFLHLWKTGLTQTPKSALTNPTHPPPHNVLPTSSFLNYCAFIHPSSSFNDYDFALMRSAHTLFAVGMKWPCINITYLTPPSISLAFGAHAPSLFTYKDRWQPSLKHLQQPWPVFHGFII